MFLLVPLPLFPYKNLLFSVFSYQEKFCRFEYDPPSEKKNRTRNGPFSLPYFSPFSDWTKKIRKTYQHNFWIPLGNFGKYAKNVNV